MNRKKLYNHRSLTYLEQLAFYGMTLIGCWAFFIQPYFFSMDGAAHVYSATILNDLVFNSDSMYAPYFEVNPFPAPNWIGHFILFLLVNLTGGIIAEKVVIALIVIGTPVALRFFLKKRGKSIIPAYVFILCVHQMLFYGGFYNFSLGIVTLLVTLYYTPLSGESITRKRLILLTILYLTLYFSHIFVLVFTLVFQGALIFDAIDGSLTTRFTSTLRQFYRISLSFIPVFVLCVLFFVSNAGITSDDAISFDILWNRFLELWAFKLSFGVQEIALFDTYAQSLWFLILLLLGFALFVLIRKWKSFQVSAWFITTLGLLVAYFVVPDSGLYLSERFFLLFFLALCIWLATVKIPKWVVVPVIILVFAIQREMQFSAMAFHNNSQKYITGVLEMEEFIPAKELVGVINCSDYWLERGHSHNYLGLNNKVIDIYNYEAVVDYFPIRYKGDADEIMAFMNDDRKTQGCFQIPHAKTGTKDMNYVILIKDKTTGKDHLEKAEILNFRGYHIIHENEIADLYEYQAPPR